MKLAQQTIIFPDLEKEATPGRFVGENSNLGYIVNELVKYLFPFAGLIMLLYLIYGGYKYLLSGGNPKAVAEARGVITTALIGFVIVFVSFWLVQIIGIAFGIEQITVIFGRP